ncbi:hypothetical protein [Flavobacterium sp. HTF]|uniref:hypothetical protein n=1 Tax=Flavobacterium sp. HTF TaxID=2170732 RepID=UPI000D5E1C11|nr:hypothetical protein [Flavobacterium sp. HTF]PWB18305.1 hypothetical protein DCO46_22505 [Flavobacterium sp. HTF]
MDEYTKAYFEKNQNIKKIFHDVIGNKAYSTFTLDSNFPKKIGKYYFFFNENEQDKTIKYAGRIDIINFKVYKDKAILILTESVGKYGVSSIVLLIKKDGDWKVYKKHAILTI